MDRGGAFAGLRACTCTAAGPLCLVGTCCRGPCKPPRALRPAVTIACGVSGRATSVTPVSARLHNSLTYFTLSLRAGERVDLERGCSRARLDLNAPVSFCPSLFRRLVEGL
jgi:hypothetical protein